MVYAYVQENVRGLDMDRHDDDPDYPTGPPRVVRYSVTRVELERRARGDAGAGGVLVVTLRLVPGELSHDSAEGAGRFEGTHTFLR